MIAERRGEPHVGRLGLTPLRHDPRAARAEGCGCTALMGLTTFSVTVNLRQAAGLHSVATEGRAEGASPIDALPATPEHTGQIVPLLLAPVPEGRPASTFVAGTVDEQGRFFAWGRLVVGEARGADGFRLEALSTDAPEEGDAEFERGVDPAAVEGAGFGDGRWTDGEEILETSPARPPHWSASVPVIPEPTGWQDEGCSGEF